MCLFLEEDPAGGDEDCPDVYDKSVLGVVMASETVLERVSGNEIWVGPS